MEPAAKTFSRYSFDYSLVAQAGKILFYAKAGWGLNQVAYEIWISKGSGRVAANKRFGITAWAPTSWPRALKLFQDLAAKDANPPIWLHPPDPKTPPSASWVKDAQ